MRHSKSLAGTPILFVKKKVKSLETCVDYCGLKKDNGEDCYPLSLISRIVDQLEKVKMYTKIDLQRVYNLVRIKEGDE